MIDFANRTIKGKSGKIYKILPEKLSSGRAAEFEIRSSLLAYNTDFQTLFNRISKANNLIRNAQSIGGNIDASNELESILKGMRNFQENKRTALIEFCSLFCIAEDEDVGDHDEDIVREKFDDWKRIPDADFFLLSANVIPSFKENYLLILNQEKQNG